MSGKFLLFSTLVMLVVYGNTSYGQCPTEVENGQNLIFNGDFSQAYEGWTYEDPYSVLTSGNSTPGKIQVSSSPTTFNSAFPHFFDLSPTGDNNMLMVDGHCVEGTKLWTQDGIPIVPFTNYFFSVWIASLANNPNYQGTLRFDINGTDYPVLITATPGRAIWKQYEMSWNSGPNPPPTIAISLENAQTMGCWTEVDFVIDDVNFIPGCEESDDGPQPDLGPDRPICGSLVLDAGVEHKTTTTVTWWDGATGTGLDAPYSRTIETFGKYSVCVTDDGSCMKSDAVDILDCAVPVEFLSFHAKPFNSQVALYWSTASEINNDHFIVQRSTDGKHFTDVGKVSGGGNSATTLNYHHMDSPGLYETIYYRIMQVDTDGTTGYSTIIKVSVQPDELVMFPIPVFSGQPLIIHTTNSTSYLTFVLYDMTGRMIYDRSFLTGGNNVVNTGALNVSRGVYKAEIISEDGMRTTHRLVVE